MTSVTRSDQQPIGRVLIRHFIIYTISPILSGFFLATTADAQTIQAPLEMKLIFANTVNRSWEVPIQEVHHYADLAAHALAQNHITLRQPQYLALVDRSPQVQAILLLLFDSEGTFQLIGAAPASTGRPGRFDYFYTPTGVFPHSIDNPDFRAEGTKNDNGIRGYGVKGMRVFDFGWQQARRGWGDRRTSTMRLQMHATDPDLLEHKLGTAQSKGCIRIPASLNRLMDDHGLLDADYQKAQQQGRMRWLFGPDRQPTPWSGRYLVVVDTGRKHRPSWAQISGKKREMGAASR